VLAANDSCAQARHIVLKINDNPGIFKGLHATLACQGSKLRGLGPTPSAQCACCGMMAYLTDIAAEKELKLPKSHLQQCCVLDHG
jgi:hypothetical protein